MTGKWRKALRKIWQEPEEAAEEEKTMSVDLKKKFRGCLLFGKACLLELRFFIVCPPLLLPFS